MGPVVAPLGTVATICVVELTVKLALTPLKLTDDGVIKFVPLMVTMVPTDPLPGENPLMVGTEFADPLITNPCEILKKILSRPSTLMRAFELGVPGMVITSEPSLGVLFARIIGKVVPPSVESVTLTFAQLTGALLVLATFQLTV